MKHLGKDKTNIKSFENNKGKHWETEEQHRKTNETTGKHSNTYEKHGKHRKTLGIDSGQLVSHGVVEAPFIALGGSPARRL